MTFERELAELIRNGPDWGMLQHTIIPEHDDERLALGWYLHAVQQLHADRNPREYADYIVAMQRVLDRAEEVEVDELYKLLTAP
jgi:hypothetical protein